MDPMNPMNDRGVGAPGEDDVALNRELTRALAIDPSPEFVARVRQRIAHEPVPSPWGLSRFTWRFAVAGAMAAVVIAIVVSRTAPSKPTAIEKPVLAARTLPGAGTLPAGVVAELAPPPRALPTETAVAQAFRPAKKNVAQAFRAAILQPEILIDRRQAVAFRNLIAGLRDGRIDPASLPADVDTSAQITIPPITIAPVTASSSEGVRQ